MGLIGKVIKISLPAGAVYYSVESGLWQPGVGSKQAEQRIENQRAQLTSVKNQICDQVDPYVKPITKELKMPNLNIPTLSCAICWYNSAVKSTFRWLADFDARSAFDKLVAMLNTPPEKPLDKPAITAAPTDTKKTESKA